MGRASNRKKQINKQRKCKKIIQTYRENPVKWIEDMFGYKLSCFHRLMLNLFYKNRNKDKVQYISHLGRKY